MYILYIQCMHIQYKLTKCICIPNKYCLYTSGELLGAW